MPAANTACGRRLRWSRGSSANPIYWIEGRSQCAEISRWCYDRGTPKAPRPPRVAPAVRTALARSIRRGHTTMGAFQADRDAERAGRPFSKLPTAPPTPESEWSPPQREAMRYFDRLAARLAQEAT